MSLMYSKNWFEDMPNRICGIKTVVCYPVHKSVNTVRIDVTVRHESYKAEVLNFILDDIEYEKGLLFSLDINFLPNEKDSFPPINITM